MESGFWAQEIELANESSEGRFQKKFLKNIFENCVTLFAFLPFICVDGKLNLAHENKLYP